MKKVCIILCVLMGGCKIKSGTVYYSGYIEPHTESYQHWFTTKYRQVDTVWVISITKRILGSEYVSQYENFSKEFVTSYKEGDKINL